MITKFQVAYKNLLRKKVRSLLTLVGIALSSWVLVSLLGFNQGYEASLNKDIDNMGFQIMVMAKGCPYEAATLMLQGGARAPLHEGVDHGGHRKRAGSGEDHPDPDVGRLRSQQGGEAAGSPDTSASTPRASPN